ncbi:MAG: hypothetical protein QOI63_833 [Thermoplasmata archaeon]|jgi:hypothetical protein|nr:hypothetical protein [Thermoplasmata archaeon]
MGNPTPLGTFILNLFKNLVVLLGILSAVGGVVSLASAHLLLKEATEIAHESLELLENEIQRAIDQNITINQVMVISGASAPQIPNAPDPSSIQAATREFREAAQSWREHVSKSDGDFSGMQEHLVKGYKALGLPEPKKIDYKPVTSVLSVFGRGWPIPALALWLLGDALGLIIFACVLDADVDNRLALLDEQSALTPVVHVAETETSQEAETFGSSASDWQSPRTSGKHSPSARLGFARRWGRVRLRR